MKKKIKKNDDAKLKQRIKDVQADNPKLNYVQCWEIAENSMAREGISDIDRDHGTVVVKISAESHSLMSSYKKLYGLTFAQLVDLALGALIDQSEDGKLHGLHGVRK